MSDLQLTLTAEERQVLVDVLKNVLKNELVEEHRTRTPSYRENVIREEKLLGNVLTKLGQPPQ